MPGAALDFRAGWLGLGAVLLALHTIVGLPSVLGLAWVYVLLLDVVQHRTARRRDA